MLSGIGPAAHLKHHGVRRVLVDNPAVGRNMQSQVGMGQLIYTVDKPVSYNPLRLFINPFPPLWAYIKDRSGPLAGVSGFDALGNVQVRLFPSYTSDINFPTAQTSFCRKPPRSMCPPHLIAV